MKNLSTIDEAKDLITKEWLESGSNNLALQAKTLHVGGNASLEGETLADSIIAGSLLVNGDARFVNTIQGNASTASTASNLAGEQSNLAVPSTALTAGYIHYYYNVNHGLTGNMPTANNANGILMLNRHRGDYHSFLGFSSDGRLYYKTALATSATWSKIAWTSDIPTSLPASDVSAWAKKSSLAASDVPSLDWSKITTGKPTTISGYGITDAITTSNIGSQNVSYATSAGHLQDKLWSGGNLNGDGMPFTGYKKLATLQCGVWMIVNTTFAVHSRHCGTLRYSLSLRLNDSYASYDCFVKAFGVTTESDQLRFFYNTSTGVFTIWKYFYDYDYTYVTTEYSTYLEFNGDDTQYSDIPAGQGTEIGVDVNVANSINNNEIVLKNPYDPTNYRITLRSDWDWAAHTRLFGANGYELLRGVRNNLSLMPDNNGNVGVGVTTPTSKLHVNGRIAVNGPEILNWSASNGDASIGELGWYGISKYDCGDDTGGWGLRLANFFGMQYVVGGNYQHYFEGQITCSSEITAYSSSDIRLKTDIHDFKALDTLKSLGGYKAYRFNGLDGAEDTTTIRYGLIYQNVVKSEFGSLMAYERENGYGALNYVKADYINLIGASVLEVEDEVITLKKEVASLKAKIKKLEAR